MAESGFQGVLFVRPSPDTARVGPLRYQLVYGHRRRRAWRIVCTERGQACMLPVIVREFSDQQTLTVGAQENLQREDLTPLEEAQLVCWHQEVYYPAGLGDIGRMLGKSEDWAKTRARVNQLPDPLKEVIRRSPHLMTGMLELRRLWEQNRAGAESLAEQAERESLTLPQIRLLVADALGQNTTRESNHDQRVNAPNVITFTGNVPFACAPAGANDESPALDGRTAPLHPTEQRLEAETERMLTHLRRWQQMAGDPAQRDRIRRSYARILSQIQQLAAELAEE